MRHVALLVLPLLAGPLLLGPVAQAAPGGLTQTPAEQEAALKVSEAAGMLEDSSQEVKAAAAALAVVAEQLPLAQADVARARGELAGARAKAKAALAAVERAEQAERQAQVQVDAAGVLVDQGRDDVSRFARRTYQRGALGDLRDVMDADAPQDVVVRAALLRSVFRSQNSTLARLTRDRLELASTRAQLAAEERSLQELRRQAEQGAARAEQIARRAESAQARVVTLSEQRRSALASAETARAQDARDYEAAQQASRELGERIREAARKAAEAAAAEARRQAAAAAAETRRQAEAQAARQRAGRAARPAAPAAAPPAAAPRATAPRAAAPPAVAPRRATRTGDMQWPAPGRLTSRFGNRTHPIFGGTRFHSGIDMGGGLGARVSAADGGTVTFAGSASGYGTLVVVSHGVVGGQDLSTAYAHMGRLTVTTGQSVSRGTQVGEIGNEGNSTGPHLHFEVRLDGNPVDPLRYVSPP